MNWEMLSKPWQACLDLAWEAYCNDCIPIGAVVTDADGNILARGRNRIFDKNHPAGRLRGNELAHAEVEALQALDYTAIDAHTCILYTSTEPCPMFMGTFYMSGLRTLHFASRDPWAGSVNLLGTTWYLSRKPIKVAGPLDPLVETILVALFVEQDFTIHGGELPAGAFYARLGEVVEPGIAFGRRLWHAGELRRLRQEGASAEEMFNRLVLLAK
jgi:tRNA(Arg) A34 adenosine deaminase TadA